MRILTVLGARALGVETAVLTLVHRWREMGLQVRVLGANDEDVEGGGNGSDQSGAHRGTSKWRNAVWLFSKVPAEIRRWRPDVIFCPDPMYAAVAVAARTNLGRRCPPIVASINHVLDARRRLYATFPEQGLLRSKQHGERGTTLLERLLVRSANRSPELHLLAAPGALLSDLTDTMMCTRRPSTLSARRSYVLLGNPNDPKSFVQGVRAFALAGRLGDRLTIVGYGKLRVRLQKWGRALHVDNVIDFASPAADPLIELRKHDVLILPSRDPGVPNALLYALAGGLRVIASDTDASVRSLLDDGALGALAPWDSVVALSHAMLTVPVPCPRRVVEKLTQCSLETYAQTLADHFYKVAVVQAVKTRTARNAVELLR